MVAKHKINKCCIIIAAEFRGVCGRVKISGLITNYYYDTEVLALTITISGYADRQNTFAQFYDFTLIIHTVRHNKSWIMGYIQRNFRDILFTILLWV